MSIEESYKDKVFTVTDPDARLRRDDDPMAFVKTANGAFEVIPQGTGVRIVEIRLVEVGSKSRIVFGRAAPADGGTAFGWTSTRNVEGGFVNETIGAVPPDPGAGRFGPNAAWSRGEYMGQVELAAIVDSTFEIERIALKTAQPFQSLVAAAAEDGVDVLLNSGFRSWPEQKILFDGFSRGLPGFNTAAKPGFSNHQNGIAFDISVRGGDGNPTYEWLKRNATRFGFVRTVSKEPWHWEFDETRAKAAEAAGTFKTPNVTA